MIATTPKPPYYAVIFTATPTGVEEGYATTAGRMLELAQQQPGFLGIESAGGEYEITVSYWQSPEDIANWKNNYEHLIAQSKGRTDWYKNYKTRICRVERDYGFEKQD